MTKTIIIPPAVVKEMVANGEFLDPCSCRTSPSSVKIHVYSETTRTEATQTKKWKQILKVAYQKSRSKQ